MKIKMKMMKNLKSFNESSSTKVWMVIITDVGGFISEEESKCFLKKNRCI